MDRAQAQEAARGLMAAALEVRPLEPLRLTFPDATLADAYSVQMILVEAYTAQGRKPVGKKVGLTNQAGQDAFGAAEPALGHLFADMAVPHGGGGDSARFYLPRVEGELAFVLGCDLAGPGVTALDVLRATEGVMPAIEIMDTRITDWQVKVIDLVADNCSAAAYVLGSELVPLTGFDPARLGFVMLKNGRVASTGAGANVLGSPLQSMVWLANKLGELGLSLRAGEVVLTGAAAPPLPVGKGDVIQLAVDRVGEVGCYFE